MSRYCTITRTTQKVFFYGVRKTPHSPHDCSRTQGTTVYIGRYPHHVRVSSTSVADGKCVERSQPRSHRAIYFTSVTLFYVWKRHYDPRIVPACIILCGGKDDPGVHLVERLPPTIAIAHISRANGSFKKSRSTVRNCGSDIRACRYL